jgi:hypothetical protein
MSDQFDWATASRQDFEKTVEALIYRKFEKHRTLRPEVIDGRGGDGGIDIRLVDRKSGDLAEVFQLKHFREGFSGGHMQRRRQIEHSFNVARRESPRVWTLIAPCEGTPAELAFVKQLAADSEIDVQFMGRTALNLLLAKFPELHDWATRETAVRALRLIERDSAVLNNAGDLEAEVRRLNDRAMARDPYWREDFAVAGSAFTRSLVPLTPDAQLRSPINYRAHILVNQSDPAAVEGFERMLKFGGSGSASFEVSKFEIQGPEWLSETMGAGTLELRSLPQAGRPARLTLLDENGKTLSSIKGECYHIGSATEGGTIELRLLGGLKHTWRMRFDDHVRSATTFHFDPTGHSASDARQALRYIDSARTASRIKVKIEDFESEAKLIDREESGELWPVLVELIDDLAALERARGIRLDVPVEIPDALDRVWIRVARLLCDGKAVALPNVTAATATLTGSSSSLLEQAMRGPSSVRNRLDLFQVDVLDEVVAFDDAVIFHPSVTVTNARETLRALRAGEATDRNIEWKSREKVPFAIFRRGSEAGGQVELVPWGLSEMEEHPKFERLVELIDEMKVPEAG